MSSSPSYPREDLETIISAAFALAVVDGHVHDREAESIFAFLDHAWQESYGDLRQLAEAANRRAFKILGSGSAAGMLEDDARSLSASLDSSQKDAVLSLLASVMTADGQEGKREMGMFKLFLRHLYEPDTISRECMGNIISVLLL